jgi:UDP-N-acetylmuramoyl-tripeptide--D-alanyl-D-alanine ligase
MKEKFYLDEIAFRSRAKLIGESISINGFSIDTRSLTAGNLFIALRGKNFDGHNFLKEARNKGAAALVVDRSIETDLPMLMVEDTNNFFKKLAISNRDNFYGMVIGITGSNGKSSTKEILASLLSTKKNCHQTRGNKNNQIGMPLSMANLTNNYDCSILELGTSSRGEISILKNISKPNVALITNAHASHLSGLGSVDLVAEEKGCIADFCHEDGILVLLRESNYYQYWKKQTNASKVISFGKHPDADFQIYNIEVNLPSNKTTFCLKTKKID